MMGQDALTSGLLSDLDALRGLEALVLLDTHHSAIEGVASVVFPTRHAAEKLGTFTNHAGYVQRVVPAVEPAFDARDDGALCWALGAALDLAGFDAPYDAARVSRSLGESVAAYGGIDIESVGEGGRASNLKIASQDAARGVDS